MDMKFQRYCHRHHHHRDVLFSPSFDIHDIQLHTAIL